MQNLWLAGSLLDNNSEHANWYPCGTICFQELRTAYDQGGGTDAVVTKMQLDSVTNAFLNQNSSSTFRKWFSEMNDTWTIVSDLISKHIPSFLATLQLLQVVKQHSDAEWSQWAPQFIYKHRDSSFTMQTLLDEIKAQSKQVDLTL
jgi:hypothetical protein